MIILAGCIIKNDEGKALFLHRNSPNRTQWELPGGKVNNGEEPEAAAIRELKEELGITVKILKKIGDKGFVEDGVAMHYHWYLGQIIKGKPILKEERFDQLRYYSWSELTAINTLSLNTQNLLQEYQSGNLII